MLTFGVPPAADEIEVTVLGPGYGESIVIHATNGFWIVIDSCIPRGHTTSAAISYLNDIGVDLANVKFVVATHWHDDHVRGLSQLLEMSPNAKLVLALALQNKQFMQIASAFSNTRDTKFPGASEIEKCLRTVRARTPLGSRAAVTFASAGRILWDNDVNGVNIKIDVLSPSDADNTEAIRQFSENIPRNGEPINRLVPGHPNHTAMAIQLSIGDEHILLGADLEKTRALDSGWDAVISDESRTFKKSTLYKVAHHGSVTGHHEEIWTKLLADLPLSLLTPFRRGRVRLPKDTDVQRIRSLSAHTYTTSPNQATWSRTTPAQRALSRRATNVQVAIDAYGALRARKKLNAAATEWAVERFGAAAKL